MHWSVSAAGDKGAAMGTSSHAKSEALCFRSQRMYCGLDVCRQSAPHQAVLRLTRVYHLKQAA